MLKLELNPPRSQLSQFGWFSLVGFGLIGAVAHYKFGGPDWLMWTLAAVGVVVFALSRIDPQLVRPVFVGLMIVALPIGLVISYVMMGLIFYGLFTPVGLLFRLTGRDPLQKRTDPAVPSYWHVRGAPRSPASYFRLY